jgi:hypothetical protein
MSWYFIQSRGERQSRLRMTKYRLRCVVCSPGASVPPDLPSPSRAQAHSELCTVATVLAGRMVPDIWGSENPSDDADGANTFTQSLGHE